MCHVRRSGLLLVSVLAIALLSTLVGCGSAATPAYPQKPISMLIGWAPGGATDLSGRRAAAAVQLPQPIVVVNKPGANGAVASAQVAQANPDGYNICWAASAALVLSPLTDPTLPYKTTDDYTPIVGAADMPEFLIVRSDSPWKTLQQFVDYAKANPGKLRVAPTGQRNIVDAALQLFIHQAGIDVVDVPTSGSAEVMPELLGGHIDAEFDQAAVELGNLKAGKVRFLAVTQAKRMDQFPDVPTFKELGYDVTLGPRLVVHGPKGLPAPIVDTLSAAFKKAFETDSYQQFLKENALPSDYQDPKAIKATLDQDSQVLVPLTKQLGWAK